MSNNTSISLVNYFDQIVNDQISGGKYKNISEVIKAGLRVLENRFYCLIVKVFYIIFKLLFLA